MIDINNKKVVILGAQRSGLACARLVRQFGGLPLVSDINSKKDIQPAILAEIKRLAHAVEWGGHSKPFIKQGDVLVISPGISIFSQEVIWAQEEGMPVLGEIEFAFQFCDKPIIAVTGSNGKSTTVTLIDLVLKEAGLKSCLCGNIGYPFSNYVADSQGVDYFVMEVSSFQLESVTHSGMTEVSKKFAGFKPFKPYIAVILNLNQNHLDRHQDMNEYLLAKKRIFINQNKDDYLVLHKEAEFLNKIKDDIPSTVRYFGRDENSRNQMNLNQLAVCQVAEICKIDRQTCENVFCRFEGIEHRMEWVRELEGVEYINDSKSTSAESCIWALDQVNRPVVMICGGKDKNIDYGVVKEKLRPKVRKVIVFGQAKEKIAHTFEEIVQTEMCDFLQQAIVKAREYARQGDCVLFSPMCASFDMFSNFEQRGQKFKEFVNELK